MIQASGIDQLAQHVSVFIVALLAAVVVARRVFGVFETRPASPPGAGDLRASGPACSHCTVGRAGSPSPPTSH